jgi:recombination protein RecT
MAKQEQVGQALETIPEAKGIIEVVQQAAREVRLDPVHLVKVAAVAIRLNPKLAKCSPQSFIGSLIVLEQVGLEPVAGRAYLIPFNNNRKVFRNGKEEWRKVLEVQALIGYKGYSDLFYRHESALSIEAHEVYQKDTFEYEYGTASYLKHKPTEGDRGPVIKYYCLAKMKDGAVLFKVMTKEECIDHGKKHSKVFNKKDNKFMSGTPWVDDVDSMCKKTVLLQLTKNLPLSIETQKAISVDETSREYRPGILDATTLPDTTNWSEQEEKKTSPPATEEQSPKRQSLPKNVLETISTYKEKLGEKKFMAILGSEGYESIQELPNIDAANKLIRELSKACADK